MAQPILVNQSTTLIQIDTSVPANSPHIVLLSNVNSPGSMITIRDTTGNAGQTNIVIVSTTNGVSYLDGGGLLKNIYTINQPYGYLTVTPKTSNIWGVINTFAFPDASASANLNFINVSSMNISTIGYIQHALISTASISTLCTNNVYITDNLSVGQSTIAHAGFYVCSIRSLHDIIASSNIYAGSTISSMFGNFTSTLTVPYISTTDVWINGGLQTASSISTSGPMFVGSSISTTGNLAVGASTFIQGQLTVLQAAFFRSSISTTGALNVGYEAILHSSLQVAQNTFIGGNVSTMSNVTIGASLSVMSSLYTQWDIYTTSSILAVSSFSTLHDVNIRRNLSTLGKAFIGQEVYTTSSILITGTFSTLEDVNVRSNVSILGNLYVKGKVQLDNNSISFQDIVASSILTQYNISSMSSLIAGGGLYVTQSTILFGTVSTMSNFNIAGLLSTASTIVAGDSLIVKNTGYFGSSISTPSSIGVGGMLMVGGGVVLQSSLSTFGQAAFFSSLQIQGSLSVMSSIAAACNVFVGGTLTTSNLTLYGSTSISTLAITNTVDFGFNVSSSTLHHGLFSTSGAMNIGGLISTTNALIVGSTINTQFLQVQQTMSVFSNAGFAQDISARSSLYVNMSTVVNGGFWANNSATMKDTRYTGAVVMDGTLNVGGTLTVGAGIETKLNGLLTVADTATFSNSIRVDTYTTVQNRISNDTFMKSLTVNTTLGVTGLATFVNSSNTGTLGVAGLTTLANSSNTGTLGVAGLTTLANSSNTGTLGVAGAATFGATATGFLGFTNASGLSYIQSYASGGLFQPILFTAQNGTPEYMRLTTTGLGINCNSPRYTLDVNGPVNATSLLVNGSPLNSIFSGGTILTEAGVTTFSGSALFNFNNQQYALIDPNGTFIYVADTQNNRILRITVATGMITRFAGSGAASSVDGIGPAATFYWPSGICIDSTGTNLYVSEQIGYKIRKITIATAAVVTLAGSGEGDADGTGGSAQFRQIVSICIDPSGTNLYVTDQNNFRIRKIAIGAGTLNSGVVTTVAGTTAGFQDGSGSVAKFNNPSGICIDPTGTNLYVSDNANQRIRKIVISTTAVTTFAGTGTPGFLDGSGSVALFNNPNAVCIDPTGTNLYVTDNANHRIRKIVVATAAVTTFAGTGTSGSTDGNLSLATFSNPCGITIDSTGQNLYVSQPGNSKIRKIGFAQNNNIGINGAASSSYALTVNGSQSNSGNFYAGSSLPVVTVTTPTLTPSLTVSAFNSCVDPSGTYLYIANTDYHAIFRITIATGASSLFAGESGTSGTTDATGAAARFNSPAGICIDSSGTNLYIADTSNHRIRKIVVATAAVTTFAGSGTVSSVDGIGPAASFNAPYGICIDSTRTNLYIAEQAGCVIRKITIATANVILLAGNGTSGSVDGTGSAARFSLPSGICVDPTGTNLYVSDTAFSAIRQVVIGAGTLNSGVVTTIAGGILVGNGSTESPARFNFSYGICINSTGTVLYVADTNNHSIRQYVISSGTVSTFVGLSGTSGLTDSPPRFNTPRGICFYQSGNTSSLYVCDFGNSRIRKITIINNTPLTVGTNIGINCNAPQYALDVNGATNLNGEVNFPTATEIRSRPDGVRRLYLINSGKTIFGAANGNYAFQDSTQLVDTFTIDNSGNVVASGNMIIATGVTTPLAKLHIRGGGGVGVSPSPTNTIAFESASAGYIHFITTTHAASSSSLNAIHFWLNNTTQAGSTTAGTGNVNTMSVTGVGVGINCNAPAYKLDVNGDINCSGNLKINGTNVVTTDSVISQKVLTIAGSGASTDVDGTGAKATFYNPEMCCIDPSRTNLYVISSGNGVAGSGRVRKIEIATGIVTTLITITNLWVPRGICIDPSGNNLYISSVGNNNIFQVSISSSPTYIRFAGRVDEGGGQDDGIGTAASFSRPRGICIDPLGTFLYVCDSDYNHIRRIEISTKQVTTLSGTVVAGPTGICITPDGTTLYFSSSYSIYKYIIATSSASLFAGSGSAGAVNGIGASASFNEITNITIDSGTFIYVADSANHRIRRCDTSTRNVTTLAGSSGGYLDAVPTSTALFMRPDGVFFDSLKNIIYVCDRVNNRIRSIFAVLMLFSPN